MLAFFLLGLVIAPGGEQKRLPSKALPSLFVIVMENKGYDRIIGNTSALYLNQLANAYGLSTQYYAVSHPSLPNYLSLTAGSTFGIKTDCTTCYVDSVNLADQLETNGHTWRAYMETMPSACFAGSYYPYMQKHDPWVYYDDIRNNLSRCQSHVVPFTQFATDLANGNVPNFVWITPNQCNDMHDCSVATGDNWLSTQVPLILNSDAFRNGGVLFITWDEGSTSAGCCAEAAGGRVATIVVSPLSKHGYRSSVPETHYSLLRTIEDFWGLPHLKAAGCECTVSMHEYFN